MAVTLSEIAKKAGVSTGLVSRLLRDDASLRISTKRRKHVLEVVEAMGGVTLRAHASAPLSSLTKNFAVPISRMFSPQWVEKYHGASLLFRSLEEYLRSRGFRLSSVFIDTSTDEALVGEIADLIKAKNYCDGVILLEGLANVPLAKLLSEHPYPHVSTWDQAESFNINTVVAHSIGGTEKAVHHLKELGHSEIGFWGPRQRYGIFLASIAKFCLPILESYHRFVSSPGNRETKDWLADCETDFSQWLDTRSMPTAVICSNDELALAAIEVMKYRGLEPGRDISIVGHDNIEQRRVPASASPMLTTVDYPADVIGRRCGELLINQALHRQGYIVHEHIPTKLIVRESTGPCTAHGMRSVVRV
jgi:DNA-binding LacI/PurR family transcriptional regulator